MSTTELLVLDRVQKVFTDGPTPLPVLQPTSFTLSAGEFVCLLGPSGSGKSTLLRITGGLLAPDAGQVFFDGQPLTAPHADIGFVFQRTNLMPWRTVLQNVLLPIEVRCGGADEADRRRALDLLRLMDLDGFENAYPRQLSGGMSQRVVLARALMQQSRLLLMDEPFGALDALTRERLNLELLRIHALGAQTVLMVTHSIAEALFLADRVLVFSERPATIVAEVAVDLPRPRRLADMSGPRFGELSMEVRRQIGQLVDEPQSLA